MLRTEEGSTKLGRIKRGDSVIRDRGTSLHRDGIRLERDGARRCDPGGALYGLGNGGDRTVRLLDGGGWSVAEVPTMKEGE